jgi:peptidoglycan hydrolase CwlO-like protein
MKKLQDEHDNVAKVEAETKELDDELNSLKDKNEERNKAFDKLYEEKTSVVSTVIQAVTLFA